MRRFVQAFAGENLLPATLPATLARALSGLPPRYNIAAHAPAAVLYAFQDLLRVAQFTWGLVPCWSKQPRTGYTTVTARLERAARSRIFRGPWESRRCVVPMNGYYKWDRSAKPARPYFIHARDGGVLFAAGLWELWEKGDAPLASFAILTHPNGAIPPPLTPDGPIFVPPDAWQDWILRRPWFAARHLARLPQPPLAAYRVSRAIRDRLRDDYTLLEPVDEESALEDCVDEDDGEDRDD